MRPVAMITGIRAATARHRIADAGMQLLAIIDGRAVEIEDHDARDECGSRWLRVADVGERTHPDPSALTRVQRHQVDLTQA